MGIKLKGELSSLSHQMDRVQANKQLMDSMKNISKIMPVINKQIKLPELQKIIQKFDEDQMKNQLKQEIIDDVFDHDDDAENELIAKVLDEIGIEMETNLDN